MADNKDKKVLNVPALRFPEFTDEWKEVLFASNLERLENGATYNTNDKDGVPMSRIETISTGRIDYTKVGHCSTPQKIEHYIMRYGDILFSHINSLKHIGKTAYYSAEEPLYHGMNLLLFRCKNNVDSKFFFFLINNTHFIRKCQILAKQAVNQASISTSDLKKIKVYIPDINEQSKIQKFLSLIEKRIELQNKIIEDLKKLKSAIAETLFCTPKESIPAKRLSPYSKEWKLVKLSDICQRIQTKNIGRQCRQVLTIAAQYGLVNQEDFFNKTVASENLEGYYLLQKGDFAYNKSYSGDYTWGAIKRLERYDKGVLSPLYICFRPDSSKVDADFLAHYFESKKWYKGVADIAGEGARNHGLLNISVIDFFNTTHRIPNIDEQKRIAKILNSLSLKLSCEQRIMQSLVMQRNYLLRNMFI